MGAETRKNMNKGKERPKTSILIRYANKKKKGLKSLHAYSNRGTELGPMAHKGPVE